MRLACLFITAAFGWAQVDNPVVIQGDASIQSNPNEMIICSNSDKTIINYERFDVANGETIRFQLPNRQACVLNRVQGAYPSKIEGAIFSNGIVYFVNPYGIVFGPNSTIKAAQFFAACAHISDQDFLENQVRFTQVQGQIENLGKIEADQVHLIAKDIFQRGQIVTNNGFVSLSSCDEVVIGEMDSNITLHFVPSKNTKKNQIEVDGKIEAMQAKFSAADMFGAMIHIKETSDLEIQALHIDAIAFDMTKGEIKIDTGLILESLRVDADTTYLKGEHHLSGNTTTFATDVVLGANTSITDAGSIIYEKSVSSATGMFYTLTLDAGSDVDIKGSVGIDFLHALGALTIKSCQNLNLLDTVYAHKIEQKVGFLDTHIVGPVFTFSPLGDGGNVKIKTQGNIFVDKTIDTRPDLFSTTGLFGGNVTLDSNASVIVHDIITDGGKNVLVPGTGGNAGHVTIKDNPDMTITDKISFSPVGRIGLFGSISAQGGQGSTIGFGGEVKISRNREQFPDIATVYSNPQGSDLTIEAATIRFHENSVITSFGSIIFTATNKLTVSDHTAVNNVQISANNLDVLVHSIGGICLSNGSRMNSLSVHSSAGGKVDLFFPVQNINFIGFGVVDLIVNELNLDLLGRSRLMDFLLFGNTPLNFNPLAFESLILTKPDYLTTPYRLQPTYRKMKAFSVTDSPSIDALAAEIDALIFRQDLTLMGSWNQLRRVILEKNPVDTVVLVYTQRLRTGTFSPMRFIEQLRFSARGKNALAHITQIIDLKESISSLNTPLSEKTTALISEFTLPSTLTKEQWKDVNIVVEDKLNPSSLN
ncbi:MAG: Heme/hemopexin-binding protein [Chlamydiae bacterium]|nr:Heme/hemopexin-binding protein [Chlamydiota bacterium]